jgi:H+/Na+-translocating ferredoxin:NAD+ oxidoreductase subunit B
VAEITGKQVTALQEVVAAVRCSRVEGKVRNKYDYIGYQTCTGSNLAFGGPRQCKYACIGFGDCAQSCPFDAITMVEDFPVVDYEACVGCGTCVRTCPKKIIELLPRTARVWVPCSTREPGKQVKEVCQAGCISCRMCVKVCPAKAVNLEDNVVVIDHDKCIAYGPECGEVCVEKCPRKIFRHYRPREAAKEQIRAAG